MKVCVVGYGAMGKIVADLLGDELSTVVALECENKKLEDTDGNFDNFDITTPTATSS